MHPHPRYGPRQRSISTTTKIEPNTAKNSCFRNTCRSEFVVIGRRTEVGGVEAAGGIDRRLALHDQAKKVPHIDCVGLGHCHVPHPAAPEMPRLRAHCKGSGCGDPVRIHVVDSGQHTPDVLFTNGNTGIAVCRRCLCRCWLAMITRFDLTFASRMSSGVYGVHANGRGATFDPLRRPL